MSDISLREYFAAHAPSESQPWFTPSLMPTPKPKPIFVADEGGKHFLNASYALKECGDCFHVENASDIARWEQERAKRSALEWPWAWAKAMVEQGQIEKNNERDRPAKV